MIPDDPSPVSQKWFPEVYQITASVCMAVRTYLAVGSRTIGVSNSAVTQPVAGSPSQEASCD